MRPLGFCLLLAGLGAAAAPPARPRLDDLGDPLPVRAVARLGTARMRLSSPRLPVAVAPDGRTLAVVVPERDQVVLIDAVTGRELRRLATGATDGLAYLANGKELACAASGVVTFWDLARGEELRRVTVKPGTSETTALSADGWLLATGPRSFGRKAPLTVYEAQTGQRLASLEPESTQTAAALSPDGKWLATWSPSSSGRGGPSRGGSGRDEMGRGSQSVRVWDAPAGKELKKLEVDPGESVAAVAFAPDRKTLCLATSGGGLQQWDVASGKRLRSWRGASRSSSRDCVLVFSPDGKILVLGSRGGESPPLAWNLDTGRRLPSTAGPECRFVGVGFPGDGRILAFGVQAQAVIGWDLLSGKRLTRDAGHSASIVAVAFRADGRCLCTTASDGCIIEWDHAGKETRRLSAPAASSGGGPGFSRRSGSSVSEGLFSPGCAYLVSSSEWGGGLRVREVRSGLEVLMLPSGSRSASTLACSPDGKLLAVPTVSERNPRIRLFRTDSGEELPSLETWDSPPVTLAFGPTGRRLAVALGPTDGDPEDSRGAVRIWRMDLIRDDPSFAPFRLPRAPGRVASLSFSHDGRLLLVAHASGILRLLDASGHEVDLIDVGASLTATPVLSPDGRTVAVACTGEASDSTLSLWEVASGKQRWSAPAASAVTAMAFAPVGGLLAAGHRDSSTLLWDVTGRHTAPTRLPGARIDESWADLASADAVKAFEAQRVLVAEGATGVAALRGRLRPVPNSGLGSDELARLIRQLDDDDYAERRKAFAALAGEGRAAEPHLRKALAGKPSAELKRQARELLARLGRHRPPAAALRGLRALEVLEHAGTPEACKLVEELSRGRADAPLTREALATLARMRR